MPVRWTEPAETDFLNIYDHIADTNPGAADRVGERLLTAIRSLGGLPRRGRRGRLAGTRELVVRGLPYIIVYSVHDTGSGEPEVIVLRIVHGARQWPRRKR